MCDDNEITLPIQVMGMFTNYYFAEESTGEVMNDAIYDRMIAVEEALGVNIEKISGGDIKGVISAVRKSNRAQDDAYQMVLTHCIEGVSTLTTGGMLQDLRQLKYVDLDAEWWNRSAMENLALGEELLWAVNDFMLDDPNVIYFNKGMIDEYQLENPYELVKSGKWTLDKFIEMAKAVSQDNGDGTWDINDKYGFATELDWEMVSIYPACGIFTTEVTEDGIGLALNSEKTLSVIEKIVALVGDSCTYSWGVGAPEQLLITSGNCLFTLRTLQYAANYRDSDVEFGILPVFKYDEAQENYQSLNWSGLMCVMNSISNPDMVGAVIELLAFYSNETTIPAYYDKALAYKSARDEESIEMLNIIFDTTVYDIGMNLAGFNTPNYELLYSLPKLAENHSTDFASWYAANADAAEKYLIAMYDAAMAAK